MSSLDNQLFTVEEAFARLGESKQQGCLLVSKGAELISIYVRNGYVLSITTGAHQGKSAIEHALHLPGAVYEWIRGVQPPDPDENLSLNIQEFILTNGTLSRNKPAQTGKLFSKSVETASESKYSYFLIPVSQPTVKYYLTKTATVLGRDASSDLVIDDVNISSRHCILDIQSRGLFVLDLDSTNGTYVNGTLIRDGYVNHGEVLELGAYRLTVNREVRK
jgi:hypothetical protein